MNSAALLTTLARIRPQVWDAIIPHGPVRVIGSPEDLVALNPQPLPPQPPSDAFLIGAARMAHAVTRMAVEADLRGEATDFVARWVDDWCATPWPRKWPWPWPDPRLEDGPVPDPWLVGSGRVVGAVVLASVGARLGDGELSAALLTGAERLVEAGASA